MANEFRMQVKRCIIPIVIEGEELDANGELKVRLKKTYIVDIGNKARLQGIYTACKELSERAREIEESVAALDKIEDLAKGIITATLNDWEAVWEATGQNVFAVMSLSFYLVKVIKEEASDNLKRYGFQSNS
jgi:hypothetical protein